MTNMIARVDDTTNIFMETNGRAANSWKQMAEQQMYLPQKIKYPYAHEQINL